MTHFIKLKKAWEDNKRGDIVEVGKSTAHALVMGKTGVRASDPSKFPPTDPSVKKKKKKKSKNSWRGRNW